MFGSRWRGSVLAVAASMFFIGGCATTRGPELVLNSHVDYNKAVSQVLREELLLNIVRRRYLEPLQFVMVSSITTTVGVSADAGVSAGVDNSATSSSSGIGAAGFTRESSSVGTALNLSSIGMSGGLSFSDSPTVTITPLQGQDIAQQLHEPLPVSVVADLISAGYPVNGTLQLLVLGINDLRGPVLRYDGFSAGSPDWREAIGLIERFAEAGSLVISRFRWNDAYTDFAYPAQAITPEMWITTLSTGARRWKSYDGGKTFHFTTHEMAPAAWLDDELRASADGARLMELLNVQPDVQKKAWLLEPARVVAGADLADLPARRRPTLKLRMRSLYNVISLYAYMVDVPAADEAAGRATDLTMFRECVARGEIDDFTRLTQIKWSARRPETAFIAVRHRNLWFYIDDADQPTKVAFNALYDLWQLSLKGSAGEAAPVTTIQVN